MYSTGPAYEIIALLTVPIVLLFIYSVYRGIKLGLYKETGIMSAISIVLFIFLPLLTPIVSIVFLTKYKNKQVNKKVKLICGHCGSTLSENDNVCSNCGYKVIK